MCKTKENTGDYIYWYGKPVSDTKGVSSTSQARFEPLSSLEVHNSIWEMHGERENNTLFTLFLKIIIKSLHQIWYFPHIYARIWLFASLKLFQILTTLSIHSSANSSPQSYPEIKIDVKLLFPQLRKVDNHDIKFFNT